MSSTFFDIMKTMKKDIVFDLGNVLVTFNLQNILDSITNNKQIQKDIMNFYYPTLWNEYDRGMYTKDEMIHLGIKTYPIYQQEIVTFMEQWVNHLHPIKTALDIVQKLKEEGHRIYILSNIPKQALDYLRTIEEMRPILENGIYSYQHKINKPDPKIFQILMDTYQLEADNIIFIDDKKENVEAAKSLGMMGIHCTDTNQLKKQVRNKL